MKRMEMFSCASQASTAIRMSNMDQLHQPSSSSSDPSCSSASSSAANLLGGRAIDRHNPIIRDNKRATRTLPGAPCIYQAPPISPKPLSYQLLQKTKRSSSKSKPSNDQNKKASLKKQPNDDHHHQKAKKLAPSEGNPDEKTGKEVASSTTNLASYKHVVSRSKTWASDFITPPGSSRYLLGETPSDLERFQENYDPVSADVGSSRSSQDLVNIDDQESINPEKQPPPASPPPILERPSNQVVVLRVSLHCKGCEGKVRKHLSRMEGVSSYTIDFKAKKVTIVGDVTPLSVLASISKVKSAQFWTATTTPSTSSSSTTSPTKTIP